MALDAPDTTRHRTRLTLDGGALWQRLETLARVGAYDDPATGLVGVNRQSLTDEDAEGRRLLITWMTEAGLDVTIDEMGNIFGRREGADQDLAPVVAGSHIDSVGTAGAFDGCLGVLSALEVIRALDRDGVTTRRPVVVVAWTEEEGVRFGTDMLGSAVAAGRLSLEYAYGLTDAAGDRFVDELQRIGFQGHRPVRIEPPHAYVECHIEQGPVLLREGLAVGVVTGVQAISWQRVTLHGRAAHAGTTPTELRVDAGLAAAQITVHVRGMVDSGRYGQLRGTVGHISTSPGLPSVVPDRAEITVDLRNPDDAAMARAEEDLAAFLETLPKLQPGLAVEVQRMAKTHQVPFDPQIQDIITSAAAGLGFPTMKLMSGAGHDAQEMAAITPTAMIFVRGQYDGISHNPREYSTPEDCLAGLETLGQTMLELAS
ncbi:M20 family metallo-hydrolase [Microbacterium enclense]|uniref:N-carbamoyl-L-amino-acid hydrolase n=1 Tax=Microbacterium enclense TaxID=993073 RepID=A0A1G6JGF9_9MICO|nr:M20 family metallo-hydrolase [Microbacterium enclense]KSU54841.1 Zn-dependent hydrolase [Microbacterium enclense]SDC17912.1 N-carbamoyl-L-amino-acid hydrolase [Microbacterium enclense]